MDWLWQFLWKKDRWQHIYIRYFLNHAYRQWHFTDLTAQHLPWAVHPHVLEAPDKTAHCIKGKFIHSYASYSKKICNWCHCFLKVVLVKKKKSASHHIKNLQGLTLKRDFLFPIQLCNNGALCHHSQHYWIKQNYLFTLWCNIQDRDTETEKLTTQK